MRYLPSVLSVLFSTVALLAGARDEQAPPVEWHEDYDAARALARKTGKPLFVVFRCER
jgi:hypothetical protein